MRTGPRWLLLVGACAFVAGCGGGSGDDDGDRPAAAQERTRLNGADRPTASQFPKPRRGEPLEDFVKRIDARTGVVVAQAVSVLRPGRNRLAFGVLDQQGDIAYAPTAVYVARRPFSGPVSGPHLAPADLLITEPAFRSRQAASEDDAFAAVYDASVPLPRPGRWAALVITRNGNRGFVGSTLELRVTSKSPVPDVGDRAPAVKTDTLAQARGDVEKVDTRVPPSGLQATSFDQVVGRKPTALLFATPQLCQSRVCGPVVDIALQLRERFGDQVEFIHQEVYRDNDPEKGLREPLRRFGLPTEPWLFVVDRRGRITERLEGSFGLRAFERAVRTGLR